MIGRSSTVSGRAPGPSKRCRARRSSVDGSSLSGDGRAPRHASGRVSFLPLREPDYVLPRCGACTLLRVLFARALAAFAT